MQLRQKIRMVFQKTAAFDGAVADNIGYGPRLNSIELSETHILDLMKQAALETDLINHQDNVHQIPYATQIVIKAIGLFQTDIIVSIVV